MNDRELAMAVIDRLKATMGKRLIIDQSDSDFVTDMAAALRDSLPGEVAAAPNWHMAAHRWANDNQLRLLASALWWSGDGYRSEVLAVFLDDKGVPQRHVLELERVGDGRKQVTAVKPCPPDTCMCQMRKIEVSGDSLRAFCCPKHGPKLDLWAIHEEGVEEGRAINHDELAELDLLRQEPRLTPTERDYLATVVKSLNPREDLMGAMMSRTWHQDLGEGGVARLAAKLEGNDEPAGITIVAQKNPGVPIPPEGAFHLFRDHDTKLKVKDADGTVRDATEAEIALGEQLTGGRFRP